MTKIDPQPSHLQTFPKDQYHVLLALKDNKEPIAVKDLAEQLGIDQIFVAAAGQILTELKLVNTYTTSSTEYSLGKTGQYFAERGKLPERIVIEALSQNSGALKISELGEKTACDQKLLAQSLKILQEKGWTSNERGELTLTSLGTAALDNTTAEDAVFSELSQGPWQIDATSHIAEEKKSALQALRERSQFVQEKERSTKLLTLTDAGRLCVSAGIEERVDVTTITPDLLKDGAWRKVNFRPYNIQDEAQVALPGKPHPFVQIIEQTRKTFLEMGFAEVKSPHAESAFWDFDALFQPQDHPARDMQDTFYLETPATALLPDADLVERTRRTHEDGGSTGSTGWGYKWSSDLARKTVLRTHTTAASIRALHAHPQSPYKAFCIGRVFRRETIDYKHLPVFYQVDGIIVDKHASLANLIWVIREFYRKMGFSQVEVRPSFFPYTEPSLEVFVYMKSKNEWVEMGGAGVFRPEVTRPLGCDSPVLAWGFGLERLAMFTYNLKDIRDIYLANIKWLREVTLCR